MNTVAKQSSARRQSALQRYVPITRWARHYDRDDLRPDLAAGLEKRGARTVLVAGKPGEHETAWRESGVTGFIHMGCDQVRLLVDLLQEEGVLHV